VARILAFLRNTGEDVKEGWGHLAPNTKVQVSLALVFLCLAIVGIFWVGSRPHFVPLFGGGLASEDVIAIRNYLDDQGVTYELKNQGTSVHVPSAKRTNLRVELNAQNLPSKSASGVGWEIFDTQSFGDDKFMQEIKHQRAVKGSILQQIEGMDFVRSATIEITHAKNRFLARDRKPSEAAVTVDVPDSITDEQIDTLVGLIAYAGGVHLDTDNIALMTTSGRWLKRPPSDKLIAMASNRLEHQNEVETYLKNKISQYLAEAGQSMAAVGVRADVSMDTVHESRRDMSEGTPVSKLVTTNDTKTNEPFPTGQAGAAANPPEGVDEVRTTLSEERKETWENLEPSSTLTETDTPPGNINDVTVAVTLDWKYTNRDENDAAIPDGEPLRYTNWEPEELDDWADKIALLAGPGIDPANVIVDDHPLSAKRPAFDSETPSLSVASLGWWAPYMPLLRGAGVILALLIGFIILRRLALSAISGPQVEELPEDEPMDIEELRRRQISESVDEMSKENPEQVASLLRSWIGDTEE
jgi:flagellar M-ring protein FliF